MIVRLIKWIFNPFELVSVDDYPEDGTKVYWKITRDSKIIWYSGVVNGRCTEENSVYIDIDNAWTAKGLHNIFVKKIRKI